VPRKPCSFGATYSQSNLILLTPRFSFLPAPAFLSENLLRRKDACLPERSTERLWSVGSILSPVHLQGLEPQRVSYYAFFEWWLLLSLHPRCLRFKTPFVTLSIHLGTLTPVSLVRVFEQYLTHCPPFLFYVDDKFRVGTGFVTFRSCKPDPYFTSSPN
jgi:hypothetical protein